MWTFLFFKTVPESTNKLIIKAEVNNNSCYLTWMQRYLHTYAYIHP